MIDHTVIEQLARDVCTTMLGLELAPCTMPDVPGDNAMYFAHIGIDGDWQSELCIVCPASLAQKIASAMFMTEPDDLGEGEIGDAVGELVNILGGNVKGIMPGENQLSLPSILHIDNNQIIPLKCKEQEVHFLCEGEPLSVRFCEACECCGRHSETLRSETGSRTIPP